MAVKKSQLARLSTTTENKKATIDWQTRIVKRVYDANTMNGYAVSLPGCGAQLERHIKEMESYFINTNKIIFVDIEHNVVRSLKRMAKIIGWNGLILKENMFDTVRRLWAEDKQVDVIDFDGLGHLEKEHLKFIEEACEKDVKVFILVLSTRNSKLNSFLYGWKCRLGLSKYDNNGRQPCKLIQAKTVEQIAKKHGYTLRYHGYRGRSPMVSCVLTKN